MDVAEIQKDIDQLERIMISLIKNILIKQKLKDCWDEYGKNLNNYIEVLKEEVEMDREMLEKRKR